MISLGAVTGKFTVGNASAAQYLITVKGQPKGDSDQVTFTVHQTAAAAASITTTYTTASTTSTTSTMSTTTTTSTTITSSATSTSASHTTTAQAVTATTTSNSTSTLSHNANSAAAANSTSTSTTSTFTVSHQTNSTTQSSMTTSSTLKTNSTTAHTNSTSTQTTIKTTSNTTALTTAKKLNLADPPSTVLLTVDSSPSGTSATVSVDDSMIAAPHTFNWTIGSSHLLAANSSFSCGSGCQWAFTSWSDGGSQAHLVTASNATTLYTASFHLQYYLTTITSPSNSGTVTPVSGWVNNGNMVNLQAFSASSFQFSSWSCSGVNCYNGTSSSPTITVTSPVLEIAGFQQTPSGYSVTFQENGLPPGVVWSILVGGNYYITGSSSLTVTGLSGTVNYAYQGIVFGNYLYNQYYYMNCYNYNQYCYNNWNYYNQYFNNYNLYANYPYYLSEFVCVFNCQGSVSGGGSTTSNYVFYQTINPNPAPQPSTYSSTFQEYGLPPGTLWSITVGDNYFSASDSSITVYGLSGTVNYAYENLVSSFYCQSNCSGSIPYSGYITANYQPQPTTVYTVTTEPVPVPEFNSLGPLILILAFLFILILRPRKKN